MTNPEKPKWVRVDFDGQQLWVEEDVLRGDREGPLAPLDHVRDGYLDYSRCFASDSYAHVYAECISRFGVAIGTRDDLKPVGQIAVIEAPADAGMES